MGFNSGFKGLRSSTSFLRLLPCLPVTSVPPCIFPSVTRCRRQFLRKMWPIQFAFRVRISCRIFLWSLTLSNTSSFLTWSVQLMFSILLQHRISKLSRCFWSSDLSKKIKLSLGVIKVAGRDNCLALGACWRFLCPYSSVALAVPWRYKPCVGVLCSAELLQFPASVSSSLWCCLTPCSVTHICSLAVHAHITRWIRMWLQPWRWTQHVLPKQLPASMRSKLGDRSVVSVGLWGFHSSSFSCSTRGTYAFQKYYSTVNIQVGPAVTERLGNTVPFSYAKQYYMHLTRTG